MKTQEPLLKIRFDGAAVGPGKISVARLLRFLTNLDKSLQRTGRVLIGDSESAGHGRPLKNIKAEVALDLVLLTKGSPAAVLGFERRQNQASFPQMDFGLVILESSMVGLNEGQRTDGEERLPNGYDAGVLMAWRDACMLFNQGVERIEITLNHRATPLKAVYTPAGYERIQQRIKGPQTNIRTIEGRLLMADFKEHGTRCRVHPSVGDPVLCLFDEEQKEEVLEDTFQVIKQYERLKGSDQLEQPEIQAEIVQQVQEMIRPAQPLLEGTHEPFDVAEVVRETTALYRVLSIDIPKIVVVPKGQVTCGYEDSTSTRGTSIFSRWRRTF